VPVAPNGQADDMKAQTSRWTSSLHDPSANHVLAWPCPTSYAVQRAALSSDDGIGTTSSHRREPIRRTSRKTPVVSIDTPCNQAMFPSFTRNHACLSASEAERPLACRDWPPGPRIPVSIICAAGSCEPGINHDCYARSDNCRGVLVAQGLQDKLDHLTYYVNGYAKSQYPKVERS
jgi:hypothetical protein